MEDNTDIAFLAAFAERSMQQSLKGSQGLKYNRTDFRQFLNGHPNVQHPHAPMQPGQYHNNQYYNPQYGPPPMQPQHIPGYNMPINEDGVPEGTLNGPIKQYTLPSHLNVPNNGVQHPQGFQTPGMAPGMENTGDFMMPNYNDNQSQKLYLEDEQEFRDALVKEIKSQKKVLNKLNKTNEQLIVIVNSLKEKVFELANQLEIKLTPDPIPEEILDEIKDKS
jgi:hypothetical protein